MNHWIVAASLLFAMNIAWLTHLFRWSFKKLKKNSVASVLSKTALAFKLSAATLAISVVLFALSNRHHLSVHLKLILWLGYIILIYAFAKLVEERTPSTKEYKNTIFVSKAAQIITQTITIGILILWLAYTVATMA